MNQESIDYIERLAEHYKDDKDALARISGWFKAIENAENAKILKEHPHIQEIVKSCLLRAEIACEKLLDRTTSADDRQFFFASLDWASWFLASFGENPDRVRESVEATIRSEAIRAGIASNEE